MKKRNIVIFTGVVLLSINGLYISKLNRDTPYNDAKDIKIENDMDLSLVAHRGLSSLSIENSSEAIKDGLNSNYLSGVEFDVRLTKDNKAILSHSETLTDENNNEIVISESNLDELNKIKYRAVVNPIKTITDIFSFSDMSCVRLQRKETLRNQTGSIITFEEAMESNVDNRKVYIDLKFNNNYEELSKTVIKILENHPDCNYIIQSDNHELLKRMQKDYPNYRYQIIISSKENLIYLNEDFDGYAIRYNLVDYYFINQKINEGKEISIWTVDDDKVFDKLLNILGKYCDDVNYITDYPDCLYYQYKKQR